MDRLTVENKRHHELSKRRELQRHIPDDLNPQFIHNVHLPWRLRQQVRPKCRDILPDYILQSPPWQPGNSHL